MEKMRARLAQIAEELKQFQGMAKFSDEQLKQVDALNAEFEELTASIEATEKVEAMQAKLNTSTRKTSADPSAQAPVVAATRQTGGFESVGGFLKAVRNAAQGKMDQRLNALGDSQSESIGEDGGFLVPETLMNQILKKLQSDESLLARTTQFTVSGNTMSLPIDETEPWTNGVQAYWIAEGQQLEGSKHKFGIANWRLHKLAALIKTTDELLEDTVGLESYIGRAAPAAIMHKVNEAILNGNGVGKPKGILDSDFRVKIAKESAQLADTVVVRNVIKMYSAMIPASRANSVWYINPAVEPQLMSMKDDNGNFIYLAPGSQMNQSPYALLLGRPVLPLVGGAKALGDEGDIVFADLSYFYSILKGGGMKSAVSTHLLFDKDQTAYKFILRIDGSCPFKSPITTQYGNYKMSGFVTLEDRA
jgi:HK97 family phage major capsid protein